MFGGIIVNKLLFTAMMALMLVNARLSAQLVSNSSFEKVRLKETTKVEFQKLFGFPAYIITLNNTEEVWIYENLTFLETESNDDKETTNLDNMLKKGPSSFQEHNYKRNWDSQGSVKTKTLKKLRVVFKEINGQQRLVTYSEN